MILDPVTLSVLKNFSSYYDAIYIKPGNELKIVSKHNTVMGIAKVPNTFDKEFGIYSISKFLGTLSLFKSPEIIFYDKYLTISDDHNTAKFYYASEDMAGKKSTVPTITDSSIQFQVTAANLSDIANAAGVLGHTDIRFCGDGENIYIQASSSLLTSSSFSIKVGETDRKFMGVISTENLKIMPGDYTITMCIPQFVHFQGNNIEYYIVLNDSDDN